MGGCRPPSTSACCTERFTNDYGRAPDALWYIVNHHRGKDPAARGHSLAGGDDDVAVFAEARGLLLDTVELYRLVQQVETGQRDATAVRAELRAAFGRYSTPSAGDGA